MNTCINRHSIGYGTGYTIMMKIMIGLMIIIGTVVISMTNCSAEVKRSGDYEYKVKSGTIVITSYAGKDSNITIPSKIAGKKVASIEGYSFYNSDITSIKIHNSVEQLGFGSFEGCKRLKTVILSKEVTEIPDYCFRRCNSLKGICLDNVEVIGNRAFAGCNKLEEI